MEANVILCDRCKSVVAKRKCEICQIDLCDNCANVMRIRINDKTLISFGACYSHYIKLDNMIAKLSNIEAEEFFRTFLEPIKKALVLKELEEKNGKSN